MTLTLTLAQAYRRDRYLVLAGMVVISLLAWFYMVDAAMPDHQSHGQTMAMATTGTWDAGLLLLSALMWSIMMIAMMLPSATPMVLSFIRLQLKRQSQRQAVGLTWLFIAGYLIAWTLFSLAAALTQWALHGLGQMSSAMGSVDPLLAGGFLIGAGLFQWSGLKNACLAKCRSPLNFLLNEWRGGGTGDLIMGLHHGAFCIGCCWMLMLLMLVGGVMNLLWMAAITFYVLAEKLVLKMQQWVRITGILLVAAGALIILGG